jgi:hypothetical protein
MEYSPLELIQTRQSVLPQPKRKELDVVSFCPIQRQFNVRTAYLTSVEIVDNKTINSMPY